MAFLWWGSVIFKTHYSPSKGFLTDGAEERVGLCVLLVVSNNQAWIEAATFFLIGDILKSASNEEKEEAIWQSFNCQRSINGSKSLSIG